MYKANEKLRSLQLRCVEVMAYIDSFCRDNSIEYALCGGSAIGAYMYGGFIPWDDDIDIMMTRKNYDKFLKKWKEETKKYELHNCYNDKKMVVVFSKIVDPNSTYIESAGQIGGAFVDITVFDYSNSKAVCKIKYLLSRFCYYMNLAYIGIYSGNPIKIKLPHEFRKFVIKICDMVMKSHSKKNIYLQEFWGVDEKSNNIRYPKALFDHYSEAAFEGHSFRVLSENYQYLCIAYNRKDFHIPESEQVPRHSVYIDISKPYKEYDISDLR